MLKLKPLQKLVYTAIFLTFSTLCTALPYFFHMNQLPFRLSLRGFAIAFSSFLLGPWCGALIAGLSDLLATLLLSSTFLWFDLTMVFVLYGILPGLFWQLFQKYGGLQVKHFKRFLMIAIFCMLTVIIAIMLKMKVYFLGFLCLVFLGFYLYLIFSLAQSETTTNNVWPHVYLIAAYLLLNTCFLKFFLATSVRAFHLHLSWITMWSQSVLMMFVYLFIDLWLLVNVGQYLPFLLK